MRNYHETLTNRLDDAKNAVLSEIKGEVGDILYQSELISQQNDINKVLELNTKSMQLLKELINKLT